MKAVPTNALEDASCSTLFPYATYNTSVSVYGILSAVTTFSAKSSFGCHTRCTCVDSLHSGFRTYAWDKTYGRLSELSKRPTAQSPRHAPHDMANANHVLSKPRDDFTDRLAQRSPSSCPRFERDHVEWTRDRRLGNVQR
jgi:hypothetical protein